MLNLHKLAPYHFHKDFIWGSATAGHQIDGYSDRNQWWYKELSDPGMERSGAACNSWELFDEDLKLLQELGHRAYRFSIEWSRIEPEEGRIDHAALNHYLEMLRKLKAAGIHTCVTLWHFTHPQWFEARGEFLKPENGRYFLRHAEFLIPKIAPYVDSWCIFNELNLGVFSPELFRRKTEMLKLHARIVPIIRALSAAPVSTAHALVPRVPLRPDDELDIAAAAMQNWHHNYFFFHAVRTGEIVFPGQDMVYVPELKNSCDFWAVNYYHRGIVDSRKANLTGRIFDFSGFRTTAGMPLTREFCPETFVHAMAKLGDKPVWITENGMPADDDRFRIIYMMLQFEAMREAERLYHTDFRGYFHWSLLDNYEWGSFSPHFGLSAVDRQTFRRTPKPSAAFYREVIAANGWSGELFRKYCPEFSTGQLRDYEENLTAKVAVETQQ